MKTSCRCWIIVPWAWALMTAGAGAAAAAEPIALRAETFLVPPSSGSVVHVVVENRHDNPYQGAISMKGLEGWRFSPAAREVSLAPGAAQRVPFTVQGAVRLSTNSYPVEVAATAGATSVVRKQHLACTSAPYFKPTIDGKPDEWKESIPVSFVTGGKKTVISTYWNRRQLAILVAVEEDKLVPYTGDNAQQGFDAVHVAVAAAGTTTGTSPEAEATRWELLFVGAGQGSAGKCFQLATPGMKLSEGQTPRPLEPLAYDKAPVGVSREGATTYYECAIPWALMREQIEPIEGREFCLSVLVHDPDGTGVRDWGEAAGLWPWQRNRLAWCRFAGDKWNEQPPLDNKIPWGLCSSLY